MSRSILFILSMLMTGTAATVVDAQSMPAAPSAPKPPANNPYANLPPRDKFNKGELEESFNILMEQMRETFSDTNAILKADFLDFQHYRHRMNYFAGHPYINDAVKIKTEWMANVAKLMGPFVENARKYEVAKIAQRKDLVEKWGTFLTRNRAAVLNYIKNPEKLEKDKNDTSR